MEKGVLDFLQIHNQKAHVSKTRTGYYILLTAILLYTTGPSSVTGRDFINEHECEVPTTGNQVEYKACTSSPAYLFVRKNSNYTLSMTPPDYTCGVTQTEKYCTFGAVSECSYCDNSVESQYHPPKYMVDQSFTQNHWWQSITWRDYPTLLHINITISFNKTYELQSDLKITFKSSRPKRMILEKSMDFGATWEIWQYYDIRCDSYYRNGIANFSVPLEKPDTVICDQSYSHEFPYKDGNVVFAMNKDRLGLYMGQGLTNYSLLYDAYNNTDLKRFLTFTDIRIRLLKPMTDGQENTRDPLKLMRYYYAISNIEVIASCFCNLHAKYCSYRDDRTACECKHNTEGVNCERCLPLYNNRPWKPGYYVPYPSGTANACEKCECNDHADSCTYKSTLGLGQCDQCLHNTAGVHCENCITGYYRNASLTLNDTEICTACSCEAIGTAINAVGCDMVTGQCPCKVNTGGRRCDRCVDQYYGLFMTGSMGQCRGCICNTDGTLLQSNVCDQTTGQCQCKHTTTGRDCSQCKDGYYYFPYNRPFSECLPCNCNVGGSLSPVCDKVTGNCTCRANVTGKLCDGTPSNFYIPSIDSFQLQPVGGTCELKTSLITEQNPSTGRVYIVCHQDEHTDFNNIVGKAATIQPPTVLWPYFPALRYNLNSSNPWLSAVLQFTVSGNSFVDMAPYPGLSPYCGVAVGDVRLIQISNIIPGSGKAWLSPTNITIDTRCVYIVKLMVLVKGQATSDVINIDSLVMLPDPTATTDLAGADAATVTKYMKCLETIASLDTREDTLLDPVCSTMVFSTMSALTTGRQSCGCNPIGTVTNTTCSPVGGACQCKPGVYGRQCDQCAPGYYNFTVNGCSACNCSPVGSRRPICDYTTGQCPCYPRVARQSQINARGEQADLTCSTCLRDYYGIGRGTGCISCQCDFMGSNITQCDDHGICPCKATITGDKCDTCQPGYFSRTSSGCLPCKCDMAGSADISCDQITGDCSCKAHVEGEKCDTCAVDTFNINIHNPDGCQRCFCYGHGTQCTSATGYSSLLMFSDDVILWPNADPDGLAYSTHKQAPSKYLGNKMSSYSRLITAVVHSQTGQSFSLEGFKPIILVGNGEMVYYNTSTMMMSATPSSKQLQFILHESYFYSSQSAHIEYFNFYAILSDLQGVYIQTRLGVYGLHVINITMETSQLSPDGYTDISSVENCTCETNRNVEGLSCGECSQGYKRDNMIGGQYDTCTPCDCNTRGQTIPPVCDAITGTCLNCRNGTFGPQCEQCSPHVNEDSGCTECDDGYWGLSINGCQACDCDPVGSVSEICNKQTGVCTCRNNVVGDRCIKCKENYQNMTIYGCTECDECYGLIMNEVNDLREMRDNLQAMLEEEQANDNNTQLGSFYTRLYSTVNNIDRLSLFLQQVGGIKDPITNDISHLNMTLTQLRYTLDDIRLALDSSDSSIDIMEVLLWLVNSGVDQTNGLLINNSQILQGEIDSHSIRLTLLVGDLNSTTSVISNTSVNSQLHVIELTDTVGNIENYTVELTHRGDEALQIVIDSIAFHERNLGKLTSLQLLINTASVEGTQILMTSQQMGNNSILVTGQTNEVVAVIDNLPSVGIDVAALKMTANGIVTMARALGQNATNLSGAETSAITEVVTVQQRAMTIDSDMSNIKTLSQYVYDTLWSLNNDSQTAANLSINTLSEAEEMLQIMRNFSDRATAAEEKANGSLATVQEVTSLSQVAINSAQVVRISLQGALGNSEVGLSGVQSANANGEALSKMISPITTATDTLTNTYTDQLGDVQVKHNTLLLNNVTQLTPASVTCNSLDTQVQSLMLQSSTTLSKALNGSISVNNSEERLAKLLIDVQNIGNINTTSIAELRKLILQKDAEFDRIKLQSAVENMKNLVETQKEWLNNMVQRKQELKAKIQRLKDVKGQFIF